MDHHDLKKMFDFAHLKSDRLLSRTEKPSCKRFNQSNWAWFEWIPIRLKLVVWILNLLNMKICKPLTPPTLSNSVSWCTLMSCECSRLCIYLHLLKWSVEETTFVQNIAKRHVWFIYLFWCHS